MCVRACVCVQETALRDNRVLKSEQFQEPCNEYWRHLRWVNAAEDIYVELMLLKTFTSS
jgi:hypothetical protein